MNYIIKIFGLLLLYFYCVDLERTRLDYNRGGFYQLEYGRSKIRWTNGTKHQVIIFVANLVCVGTFLTMDIILTTCGCFNTENDPSLIYILAGLVRLDVHDTRSQYRNVRNIMCHEGYNRLELGTDDIALVETTSPFDKSFRIKLAILPTYLMINIHNPPMLSQIGIHGENISITPYMFSNLLLLTHYVSHYRCPCSKKITDHRTIANPKGTIITRLMCLTYFTAGHEQWWAGRLKQLEERIDPCAKTLFRSLCLARHFFVNVLQAVYDFGWDFEEVRKIYQRKLGFHRFCGMVDGTAYMLDSIILAIHHYNFPSDCTYNITGFLEYTLDCLTFRRSNNNTPALLQTYHYRDWIKKRLLAPLRKPSLHQKNVNLNLKQNLPLVLYLTLLFIVCLIFLICNRAVLPSIHS